ncbi:hypothetical protein OGAPHI_005576 [Ogataea philodendri]|uniref:Uncharacterized protein n=1 Tax=Ogataea philodendri TaxID=1378263 RepID=A0A9P8NZ08_9ASCO|nr:uncharacterized protein OGAPHI_005576 [Ogataea philodendri]KAH3662325.1 hypothetical protein OGAPHI_005576 [Ogataea philodendri]
MNAYSFTVPARIKAQVVPMGDIDKSDFEHCLSYLRRVAEIRLVDVMPCAGIFNPQAYPQGRLVYDFTTQDQDPSQLFLLDFEPFRKVFCAIGVVKWTDADQDVQSLRNTLKSSYPIILSQYLIIFGGPKHLASQPEGIFVVDENMDNIETVICDLTSLFLGNLSVHVAAYQHVTLRSPALNSGSNVNGSSKRRVSSSFDLQDKIKNHRAKGRRQKLTANFYLLAGNLKSALAEFCESINNLRYANDYLWLASALEGLALCMAIFIELDAAFQLPPEIQNLLESTKEASPSPIASPRPSFQSANFNALQPMTAVYSVDFVHGLIVRAINKSFAYYKRSLTLPQDYAPHIVLCESNLRYIDYLSSTSVKDSSELICSIASEIFDDKFERFSPIEQLQIYNSMIHVYGELNMNRKRAFLVTKLLDLVLTHKMVKFGTYDGDLNELFDSVAQVYGIGKQSVPNLIQKKVLLSIFNFSHHIGNMVQATKYGSILLRDFHSMMTEPEQTHIFGILCQAKESYEFWDIYLVQNIDLHQKDKLIQDELCEAVITLRNVHSFEIEVKSIQIATDNFPVKTQLNYKTRGTSASNTSIILKPRSHTSVSVFIVPLNHGDLKITGVSAVIGNCNQQTFKWYEKIPATNKNQLAQYKTRDLTVPVLYEQPLLSLIDVKLPNRWIMLLEGECKRFEIVLKNASNVELNQLTTKFLDSTIEPLNQLLLNKGLPPNEVYEIEYYLIKKKPFKILNKADLVQIEAHSEFKLQMEIWGKRGVKEAQLIFEYSHRKPALPTTFFRKLVIPVNVTVYPSIELVGCDIIPLSSSTKISENNQGDTWKYLEKMVAKGHQMSEFCLLALDLMNSWTEEMEVVFQCLIEGSDDQEFQQSNDAIEDPPEDTYCTKIALSNKKNARILIPIKRINFSFEYLEQRIPSLRNKQFILDTKTPEQEQRFVKHAFWYRNELLQRLRARWQISETNNNSIYAGRAGIIDLRSIRFSSKMVSGLEVEKIGLVLDILDTQDKKVDPESLELNEFYSIRLKIINRNLDPISGMLRHVPICRSSSASIEKKILYNGVLQFSIHEPIQPNESRELILGVVFLEKGEYEWGAIFDEMTGYDGQLISLKHQHLQREHLKIKVD